MSKIRTRATVGMLALFLAAVVAGCGGGTQVIHGPVNGIQGGTANAGEKLGFPTIATKNTTRVSGTDPVADAAAVALAVYPSDAPSTHPRVVTLAPTDDWEAALASSVLMASPLRSPTLLSGSKSLPTATKDALGALAPGGSGAAGGAQVIRVGDVPNPPSGVQAIRISGKDPYTLAAGIDRFVSAATGKPTPEVVVASSADPAYAMPAAGWAAESGDPLLFVSSSGIPQATRQALLSHQSPRIYALGPPRLIPDSLIRQLSKYGKVNRVGADDPPANSVAFAAYRDPPCPFGQPCAHVPGAFGWAMRSPGHGYVLLNASRTLDAAASAALSSTGTYGPQLLISDSSKFPTPVLNYFLDYATPGYAQEGPTAAVYNHGWVIGDQNAISLPVQAEMDNLLEVVPQKTHP